jgi:hypothetical protein
MNLPDRGGPHDAFPGDHGAAVVAGGSLVSAGLLPQPRSRSQWWDFRVPTALNAFAAGDGLRCQNQVCIIAAMVVVSLVIDSSEA